MFYFQQLLEEMLILLFCETYLFICTYLST